jgi:hypothetical protein
MYLFIIYNDFGKIMFGDSLDFFAKKVAFFCVNNNQFSRCMLAIASPCFRGYGGNRQNRRCLRCDGEISNELNELDTNSRKLEFVPVRISSVRQESYAMNCHRATPSIWGNLTGMCFCSNAKVQSSWDNVKKSKNPLWTIC